MSSGHVGCKTDSISVDIVATVDSWSPIPGTLDEWLSVSATCVMGIGAVWADYEAVVTSGRHAVITVTVEC